MTWILTVLSIIGVVLNIRKNRYCFLLWILTNAGWAMIDFIHGLPAQGNIIFDLFCVSGLGLV